MEFLKDSFIWYKSDERTVVFTCLHFLILFDYNAPLELSLFYFTLTDGCHFKILAQCIHGLGTYSIQSNRFLKYFAIVFRAGINLTNNIHNFTQWNATSMIANCYRFTFNIDLD